MKKYHDRRLCGNARSRFPALRMWHERQNAQAYFDGRTADRHALSGSRTRKTQTALSAASSASRRRPEGRSGADATPRNAAEHTTEKVKNAASAAFFT